MNTAPSRRPGINFSPAGGLAGEFGDLFCVGSDRPVHGHTRLMYNQRQYATIPSLHNSRLHDPILQRKLSVRTCRQIYRHILHHDIGYTMCMSQQLGRCVASIDCAGSGTCDAVLSSSDKTPCTNEPSHKISEHHECRHKCP